MIREKQPAAASKEADRRISKLTAQLAKARETILALRTALKAAAPRKASVARRQGARGSADLQLEERVLERTRELTILNEELQAEIAGRIRTEQDLRTETEARKAADEMQRALNRALRESEDRFRSVVEGAPVGICIVRDGEVLFANPAQEKFLAAPPRSGEGGSLLGIHPEDSAAFDRLCALAMSGSPEHDEDLRLLPPGPTEAERDPRWVRVRAGRLRYQGRDALLLTMLDITRSKELEQVSAVREKLASLGQLSAGIAHEIRNPLSGINIYVSTLQLLLERVRAAESRDDPEVKAIMEQIRGASAKIALVIQRVLSFSKPTPAIRGAIDLNDVVKEALDVTQPTLRKHGVSVTSRPGADLPKCDADPQLIGQVMVNLISNAVQAMDGQDRPKRIDIASAVENGRIVVRVGDTGPGVPIRLRSKIFEPFYTSRKDGFGIGLSFSHRVVTEHGGALTVGTSRWGGAEFRMELRPAGAHEAA